MKRLLLFTHTSSQMGGVETWLDRINVHLSLHGFEVVIGLVRGLLYNDPTRYKASHPNFQTVEIDGRGMNREGRVRALVRCVRSMRPDIVMPLGIVDANEAVIRCKQLGMPVRLVVHAQGNLAPMLADLASYRDWIDHVVCPGRLTREVLVHSIGFPSERVTNVSNGADPAVVPHIPREDGAPLRIGYVGRLTKVDKRAPDLIELYREMECLGIDYRLEIVGDGPCRSELHSAFQKFSSKVTMHGSVPHQDLYARIFPNLDVLVLTSSSEAFGIVLIEAMMHGVVPVSARYDGFHAEGLIQDEVNGLSFPVGDMVTAAAAIARIDQDDSLRECLSRESLAMAADYTWSQALERWELVLNELISASPLRGEMRPIVPANPASGFLDRISLPPSITDIVRRARRRVLGPAVAAGGEEWPLFYRHHSKATLSVIRSALKKLDVGAAEATEDL